MTLQHKPETWALADLKPNPKNARIHSPEQIETIRASMREFGWTIPLLIDEKGIVLAGNGRLEAAIAEGYDQAPVIVARDWTAAQKRAYAIADNRIALQSTWNETMLRSEFGELMALGFDMQLTGFGADEITGLLRDNSKLGDPEATPALPKVPVSKLGDLWICGDHRVLCGDSTSAAAVKRLLGDAKPNLMVTDPPYGVKYDPNWRNSADRSTKIKGRKIGATAVGKVQNDGRADWRDAWALFTGDVAYVWHAGLHAAEVDASLRACDFEIRSQIMWNKTCHIIGRGDYHWKHEPCWYAVRRGKTGKFDRSSRKQNTVWDIDHRASESGHGTQKPLDCMRRPIVNNSRKGDAVYDPFLGSGTTMIAAELEHRRCLGLEIDPAYVDVIVERWQNYSGKVATLDGGGTFAKVTAARSKKKRKKAEDAADAKTARKRLKEIRKNPRALVSGDKLKKRLTALKAG
jgi:DNA modification methylase